jgi:hypothetical protein
VNKESKPIKCSGKDESSQIVGRLSGLLTRAEEKREERREKWSGRSHTNVLRWMDIAQRNEPAPTNAHSPGTEDNRTPLESKNLLIITY